MSGIFKFPDYEQHPIAIELMPGGMDSDEFDAFEQDIKDRGVLMPITIYEGKVLDGWHRYRAAKIHDMSFKEVKYDGKDPAGYVASVNVMRRKLSSLQRALVGAKLHRVHNLTQREACKKLGISNEVLTLVLRAIDSKNAKLVKRIETDGDFTRGMLREELEDAGLLRAKAPAAPPAGPNSVFDLPKHTISNAAASIPDTDGSDDEEEDEHLPEVGKRPSHPERKPKVSPAQALSEEFKGLTIDEKLTFLEMITPAIRAMRKDGYKIACDVQPAKKEITPEEALEKALGVTKTKKGKKS